MSRTASFLLPLAGAVFLTAALAGCPSGDVLGSLLGGLVTSSGAGSLNIPSDALAGQRIGAEGGEVTVAGDAKYAAGVKLIVPPGALEPGTSADFYVRLIDELGAVTIETDQTDAVRAAAQYAAPQAGVQLHPLYAALLSARATAVEFGPLVELGPDNVTFAQPVEIRIPFDKAELTREEAYLCTLYSGEYEAGRLRGQRAWSVSVDYDAGVVIAHVTHLSKWQTTKRIMTAIGTRIAGLIASPFTELPDAPDLTTVLVKEIVCSGLWPHVDVRRLPDPVYLLYYLASPMDTAIKEIDPNGYAADRLYYQNQRVVTGHEVAFEDWVIAQPPDSLSIPDLFAEAYRRVGGDVFQALLLTHNLLRGFDGLNRYGTVRGDVIHQRLQKTFGGDEVGNRYHYFGTAAFSFIMRLYGHMISDEAYGGAEIPVVDIDDELVRAMLYLEECLVSGDCLQDRLDYAVDMSGHHTGQDLADQLFDGFILENRQYKGVNLGEVARRFGLDPGGCLTVDIQGERTARVGEHVSLDAVVTGGTAPYGVIWLLGGQTLMTGPEFFYAFDQVGEYTLRVNVTDGNLLKTDVGVTITVQDAPAAGSDWLVYYLDNVSCWSAPNLYITSRSDFEQWRATASYSGGGVDYTVQAIKVEMQGGFASQQEAKDWLCPQLESRFLHYWCGEHVWARGRYWSLFVGCDTSQLPVDTEYRQ
jgi:hypothetical protein